MSIKLKIGLVGLGKRCQNDYMPILKSFSDKFDIVGVTTKNIESGKEKAEKFNIRHFKDLESLNAANPDAFLVCVPADVSSEVAKQVMTFNKPIIMETPVYDGNIIPIAKKKTIKFGVVEQWPFLPIEQFKKKIIQSGVLGNIFLAENDNRSYDYHGIAQLRSYIGLENLPISVKGSHFGCMPPDFINESGATGSGYEGWDHGIVSFENNKSIIHKFCYNFKKAPFRFMQSLRIIGEKGMMVNGATEKRCNDYEMIKILFYDEKANEPIRPSILFSREGQCTKVIESAYRDFNITWENPFFKRGFTDQETAIASYLLKMRDSIINDLPVPYTVENAYIDTLIVHLIKQSAAQGNTINLGR